MAYFVPFSLSKAPPALATGLIDLVTVLPLNVGNLLNRPTRVTLTVPTTS